MPTLIERAGSALARSRLGDALFAEERGRIQAAFSVMEKAYMAGPWQLPPEELARQIAETDAWQVWDLLQQRSWEQLGGYTMDTERERQRAASESLRLYKYSPLYQWSVWLWTSWGLGDRVQVSAEDEQPVAEADAANESQANAIIEDFFESPRNEVLFADDHIAELSKWLLVKGNRFVVFFFCTMDGEPTARLIDQDQIAEFVTNPGDSTDVWYYKRSWQETGKSQRTLYYPDYKTYFSDEADERWDKLVKAGKVPQNGKRANDNGNVGSDEPQTEACILHIAHNIKDERTLWGWPLVTCGRAWTDAHQEYMEGRLTLAKAASQFVRRKKVTGGSRQLAGVRSTIATNLGMNQWTDTNPGPTAGSIELDNAMVDTTDLPLTTGASHTSQDSRSFSYMALLGMGLFQTSAGLDTARWATALEMDKAQSSLFEEYRIFWATQFRRMARIAVMGVEKHTGDKVPPYKVKVTIDTFSLADFPAIAKTIGQFVRDTITPLAEAGVLDAASVKRIVAEFWRVAMNALGIADVDDLLSDEALGLAPAGEEAAPVPAAAEALVRALGESFAYTVRDVLVE